MADENSGTANTATNVLDNVMQQCNMNENGLIIRELFSTFNGLSCGKSYKELFFNVLKGLGKSFLILLISHIIKQPNFHFSTLAMLFSNRFLYKIIAIPKYPNFKFDGSGLFDLFDSYNNKNYFQIQCYTACGTNYIKYLPLVHSTIVDDTLRKIKEENESEEIFILDLKSQKTIPDKLFPSKNFLMLERIIRRHLEFVKMSAQYINIPILIDGAPGLGKTSCLSYLAEKKVCKHFLHIDMTKYFDFTFSQVVSKVKSTNVGHTIILIDELDKWLEQSMENSFAMEKEEKTTGQSIGKNYRAEFFHSYKTNFLYELLNLIEKRNEKAITIFIFCSNNFNSIFENIKMTHFKSLKDRFMPVHFSQCQKDELILYLRYINTQFKDSQFYVEEKELERLFGTILEDIKLPFRKLNQMFILSGYEIEKFIGLVNKYNGELSEDSDLAYLEECGGSDENENLAQFEGIVSNLASSETIDKEHNVGSEAESTTGICDKSEPKHKYSEEWEKVRTNIDISRIELKDISTKEILRLCEVDKENVSDDAVAPITMIRIMNTLTDKKFISSMSVLKEYYSIDFILKNMTDASNNYTIHPDIFIKFFMRNWLFIFQTMVEINFNREQFQYHGYVSMNVSSSKFSDNLRLFMISPAYTRKREKQLINVIDCISSSDKIRQACIRAFRTNNDKMFDKNLLSELSN